MARDQVQASAGAERITVAPLPELPYGAAEPHAQLGAHVCETIKLALRRLTDLVAMGHEVVAVNRRRARCHGARRALCAIVLVARDAVLRRHVGTDHLQSIELAGYLKQCARVFGCLM